MGSSAAEQVLKYSIDTSMLIHAWYVAYVPARIPSFWKCLDDLIQRGVIRAPFEVKQELRRQQEEKKKEAEGAQQDIYRWFSQRDEFFVKATEEILEYASEIARKFPKLVRKTTPREVADPYVIALARAESCTVVSQEKPKPKTINIPSVCGYYDIRYIDLFDFVKEQDWFI